MSEETLEVTEPKNETKPEDVKPAVTVDVEALKRDFEAKIEGARKDEKNKLYPTIEKYKTDLQTKEQELAEALAKVKDFEEKDMTGDERVTSLKKELEESKTLLEQRLQDFADAAKKEVYQIRLDAEKEKVLAKYGEEVIEELISGSTIEEIQQSAEVSHSKYLEIVGKVKVKVSPEGEAIGSGINPLTNRGARTVGEVDIDKIKDPNEWAKMREKLLEEAVRASR